MLKLALAFALLLHATDWLQTRWLSFIGWRTPYPGRPGETYIETNPFMGEHPTLFRVNLHFFLTALGLSFGVIKLPALWACGVLAVWSAFEAFYVVRNFRRGVGLYLK